MRASLVLILPLLARPFLPMVANEPKSASLQVPLGRLVAKVVNANSLKIQPAVIAAFAKYTTEMGAGPLID
eukprot:497764-Pyramimonas_sp.AAC.1